MFTRIRLLLCIVPMLLLCSSCAIDASVDPPILQDDGTLLWNGFTLERQDFDGSPENVNVPENVLTTQDRTLSMLFTSNMGSPLQYGMNEVIQVNFDAKWYSLPDLLVHREQPLILAPLTPDMEYTSEENKTAYSVDLSPFGALPPRKYRLVEGFFWERLQTTMYRFAYFWVTTPGDQRPPESDATGSARVEDIVFSVNSVYAAQQAITTKDDLLSLNVTNLSGKLYDATKVILELKQAEEWVGVSFQNANLGLLSSWESTSYELFLDGPLAAGDYRIRLAMSIFDTTDIVEPEALFSVLSHGNAPEPQWEASLLRPSSIGDTEKSSGVTMTLKNPVLNKDKTLLEFELTANDHYSYGEPYEIEVLLDGNWYKVPFTFIIFPDVGYQIDPNTSPQDRKYNCNPVIGTGILPVGQYRLVKEFDLNNPSIDEDNPILYLSREFVITEFTVETTLEWRGH